MSVESRNLREWLPIAARWCHVPEIAQFVRMASPRTVVHKLAEAAGKAWVWVRQPPDDPIVRARTAFKRIKARGDIAAFGWLETDIRGVLRDREVITNALQILGDEEALIYVLIANVAREQLVSGQYHLSRGRLTAEGRLILSAYKRAGARLVQLGAGDSATYNADLTALRQSIKNGG
jgi:hypothetical protein